MFAVQRELQNSQLKLQEESERQSDDIATLRDLVILNPHFKPPYQAGVESRENYYTKSPFQSPFDWLRLKACCPLPSALPDFNW